MGGKSKTRLKFTAEQIIQTVIEEQYLSQPHTKISHVVEEIIRCCKRIGLEEYLAELRNYSIEVYSELV